MKITSIQINCAAKMSRNYQTADSSCGITIELDEGADPEAVFKEWHEKIKKFVHQECRKALADLTKG